MAVSNQWRCACKSNMVIWKSFNHRVQFCFFFFFLVVNSVLQSALWMVYEFYISYARARYDTSTSSSLHVADGMYNVRDTSLLRPTRHSADEKSMVYHTKHALQHGLLFGPFDRYTTLEETKPSHPPHARPASHNPFVLKHVANGLNYSNHIGGNVIFTIRLTRIQYLSLGMEGMASSALRV